MEKIYTKSKYDSICFNRISFILTITFLILINNSNSAIAQQKLFEVDEYLSANRDVQEVTTLHNLIYNVQPTVYINDSVFDPKGEGTISVASIDANDTGKLQGGHTSLGSVKLLLISFKNLQELQAFSFKPVHIGSMPNLEYVFLSLRFDDFPSEIFSGIQGFEGSEIVFLYESARPF